MSQEETGVLEVEERVDQEEIQDQTQEKPGEKAQVETKEVVLKPGWEILRDAIQEAAKDYEAVSKVTNMSLPDFGNIDIRGLFGLLEEADDMIALAEKLKDSTTEVMCQLDARMEEIIPSSHLDEVIDPLLKFFHASSSFWPLIVTKFLANHGMPTPKILAYLQTQADGENWTLTENCGCGEPHIGKKDVLTDEKHSGVRMGRVTIFRM